MPAAIAFRNLKRALKNDAGQTLVEYGLIIVLVAIGLVATLGLVGQALIDLYQKIVDAVVALV